jgi:hypothetical protein
VGGKAGRSAWASAAALGACVVLATTARAETTATLAPMLYPNRLGAKGAVSVRVSFSTLGALVPAPVRRATLRFPAGLTLEVPHLSSCSASRLRARGAGGCPVRSLVGQGHALAVAYLGSQTMTESIKLWLFLGPLRNLQPTVEVFGRGFTPYDKRVVLSGAVLTDSAPYGERLVLSIPPVVTLPLEPDASIATLSLTVGTTPHRRRHGSNTLRVPDTCPVGGFPLAGEFLYADGSSGTASAAVPCPSTMTARR